MNSSHGGAESDDSASPGYTVRIWERARRDIEAAAVRLADLEGDKVGRDWYQGILSEISHLSQNPRRHPLIPERRLFVREVRHTVFRRTRSSVAYRVLFLILDESDDGPLVAVFHVRHGSARPIGRKLAHELMRPG